MPGSTTTSGGGVAKVTRTAACCACAGASGTHTSPRIVASRKFLMLAVSRESRADSTRDREGVQAERVSRRGEIVANRHAHLVRLGGFADGDGHVGVVLV